MLRSRVIVSLLLQQGGLVKTTKFNDPKYLGDPLNTVRIFNEMEVDEICLLDISRSNSSAEIDWKLLSAIAQECRMPISYGGGIKTLNEIEKIISIGFEKVVVSSAIFYDMALVKEASQIFGSQSIVGCLDVKKSLFGNYEIRINNGKTKIKTSMSSAIQEIQESGAGELIFNFIDRDGTLGGYDTNFIDKYKPQITIPISVLGGAGNLNDVKELIEKYRIIGAAAGSIYCLKGKYRAVLMQYPQGEEKRKLFEVNSD